MNSTADSKSEFIQYSIRNFVRIPRDLCQCLGSVMVEHKNVIFYRLLIITLFIVNSTQNANSLQVVSYIPFGIDVKNL